MRYILLIFVMIFSITNLFAGSVEEDILNANNTLKKLTRSQSNTIPAAVMQNAKAIVVVPSSVRLGYIIGGKYGEGVASIRKADGGWSYPFFVTLGGASVGFQIGVDVVDTILVFRTQNSVDKLLSNKFTVGVGASASAGPMSTSVDRSSEIDMSAEIFTYSQSKGLFAGATLKGAVISNNDEKNRALYGSNISVKKIVVVDSLSDAYSVEKFLETINNLTKR